MTTYWITLHTKYLITFMHVGLHSNLPQHYKCVFHTTMYGRVIFHWANLKFISKYWQGRKQTENNVLDYYHHSSWKSTWWRNRMARRVATSARLTRWSDLQHYFIDWLAALSSQRNWIKLLLTRIIKSYRLGAILCVEGSVNCFMK